MVDCCGVPDPQVRNKMWVCAGCGELLGKLNGAFEYKTVVMPLPNHLATIGCPPRLPLNDFDDQLQKLCEAGNWEIIGLFPLGNEKLGVTMRRQIGHLIREQHKALV